MEVTQKDFDKTAFEFAKAVSAYYSPVIAGGHYQLAMQHAISFTEAWFENKDIRQIALQRLDDETSVNPDDFEETVFEFAKSLLPSLNKAKGNSNSSGTIGTDYYKQLLTHARELAVAWYQSTAERNTIREDLQNN